jgi:hypothetical protein
MKKDRKRYLRDLETLSAYLDDQISPKERANLEARLREDPALNSTLSDLRQTRSILNAAPRAKAPRNLTLTPEMAGIRSTGRSLVFPVFRAASVVASLLFVLVVVSDIFGVIGLERVMSQSQIAQEVAAFQDVEISPQPDMFEAPLAESLANEPLEPESEVEEGEYTVETTDMAELEDEGITEKSTRGESLEAAPVVGEAEAPVAESQMAPEEELAAEGLGVTTREAATPPEGDSRDEEVVPTLTLQEPILVSTETSIPTPIETATGIWSEDIPSDTDQLIESNDYEQIEPRFEVSGIRLVEAILGILALLTGLVAWQTRRRG